MSKLLEIYYKFCSGNRIRKSIAVRLAGRRFSRTAAAVSSFASVDRTAIVKEIAYESGERHSQVLLVLHGLSARRDLPTLAFLREQHSRMLREC
jgi:hypothetical protein